MTFLKVMDSKIVLRIFRPRPSSYCHLPFWHAKFALFGFPGTWFLFIGSVCHHFSLALNSVAKFHGRLQESFVLVLRRCIISLLIGKLKDLIGLQSGIAGLFLPLGYTSSVSAIGQSPLCQMQLLEKVNESAGKKLIWTGHQIAQDVWSVFECSSSSL